MKNINGGNKLLERIIFKKYILKSLLREGAFSKIFLGQSIIDNKSYAIKCEKIISNQGLLKNEAFKLYNLKGFGIPELISFGRNGNYNFLVETLLGKSLKEILVEKNRKINIKDICVIAIQTLERIEYIHSKNYIHRDIKPEHFLLGNSDNIINLIDFGNAKKYRSSKTGKHIKSSKSFEIYGNKIFLSLNACRGNEQSRRDDLESLGYMYIYLAKGKLPWSEDLAKYNTKEFLNNSIIKRQIFMEDLCKDLCKDLPKEFPDYMNYIKKLNFEEKPNYEYLKNLFINRLLNVEKFTWVDQNSINNSFKNHSLNKKIKKSKIILDRLLKKNNLNKKDKLIKDSINCITNRTPVKKYNKLIFNKKNESKKKQNFSIENTNIISIEGIHNIFKYNNIKNINTINDNSIIKYDLKKDCGNTQFFNFKKYALRFPQKLKNPNFSDFNKNNINDINYNKINNNIINKNNNNNIYKYSSIIGNNKINNKNHIISKFKINNNIYNNIFKKNITSRGDNSKSD